FHISLVREDVEAGMQKAIELAANGFDDRRRAMPSVEATDAAGEVDHAIAVHILDRSALGLGHEHGGSMERAANHGSIAAPHQILRARSGDGSSQLDGSHISTSQLALR